MFSRSNLVKAVSETHICLFESAWQMTSGSSQGLLPFSLSDCFPKEDTTALGHLDRNASIGAPSLIPYNQKP